MSQGRRRNRGKTRGTDQASSPPRKQAASRRREEPEVDPVDFWGDPTVLPEPIRSVHGVPDVRAVVASLGRAPISGQETAAEHWFSLVYERSAVLAHALAAAGDLAPADDPLQ